HTRSKRDWSSDVCSSDLSGMGEPGIGAAQPFRDVRVECGEPANMEFVDDGVAPGDSRRRVCTPVEWFLGYDDRLRYERGGVAVEIGRASCRERVWVLAGG